MENGEKRDRLRELGGTRERIKRQKARLWLLANDVWFYARDYRTSLDSERHCNHIHQKILDAVVELTSEAEFIFDELQTTKKLLATARRQLNKELKEKADAVT